MSEKIEGLCDDSDNESINSDNVKKCSKTDLMKISGNLLGNINFKVAFLLFMVGMIVFSDLFIDGFLSNVSDSVSGECTTTKGTMIQLLFLVIGYILIDLIVKYEWL